MSQNGVTIIDVSLRDGIQSESQLVPLETKWRILTFLLEAGVRNLQVASFVNPQRVPQMADTEALIERLPDLDGAFYSGLVLNERGLDRLRETKLRSVDLSLSCSDEHGRRNTGLSLAEAKAQTIRMIKAAKAAKLEVRAGLQCAFGCYFQGKTPVATVRNLSADLLAAGADSISLADSTGEAIPSEVKALVDVVQDLSPRPVVLHLHDTRGLGMANLLAGYEAGVRRFDTAIGGVGGCPFIPGAGGNVATEDAVHLLHRMGATTGIAGARLARATECLEQALGHPIPSKLFHLSKVPLDAAGANLWN